MAISHISTGAVATATSGASNPITCTPTLPSFTANDYAVITVVSRHDTEATPTITSGWDQEPGMSASGGGGTFGAGTGPARLTWFVRRLQGGDTAPTVSLAGTNVGRTLQACITVIQTSAEYIRFAFAMQAEATAGTGWSEAYTTHLHIKNGDFLFVGYGVRDDQHASFTAMGISATGATISAVTERADAVTGNGNDQGIGVGTTTCTANASTANPTVTATIGTSESGMTGVLRAREFTDGTKPNIVDEINTGYNGSAASRVSKTFQAKAGDILTVGAGGSDDACTVDSISGGSLTWTSQESINVGGSFCSGRLWSAEVDADKSMAVTVGFTPSVNNEWTGTTIHQYSNADTVGNHTAEAAAETPSMALTTAGANSAISYYAFDWSAIDGASRTWRAINSITPTANNGLENQYFRDAAQWTVYSAIWDDAGTAASKTTGLTAPTGESITHLAIEIKVTATGGGPVALDGISSSITELTGSMAVARPIDSVLSTIFEVSSSLAIGRSLDSKVNIISELTGLFNVERSLNSQIGSITELSALFDTERSLGSEVNTITELTGDLTVLPAGGNPVDYDGSCANITELVGSLSVARSFTSDTSGVSEIASINPATLEVVRALNGNIGSIATLQGNLISQLALSGHVDTIAELEGEFTATRFLQGSIDIITQLYGNLIIEGEVSDSGGIPAVLDILLGGGGHG